MQDTICALATPAGGAIGIIRVSGEQAINIVAKIFKGKSLEDAKTQTLHYGSIQSPPPSGEGWGGVSIIDDVLVSVFRAPYSYTGENSVEISCHGSRYIISQIIELLIAEGCRQANPGEYTQRAFLNGKMDLSQAEAVADLIASTNNATHRMAMSQLRGNFSNELSDLRAKLLHITSLLELELDFSDHEDLEFADRSELINLAEQIDKKITTLANSFKTGRAIKQGIPVAIVGKTNVGKSTLLNRLVGEERAIVSDIHGTTRDVIEDTVTIGGITFRFIDTAGLRETKDEIERIGIERTKQKMQEAAIVLYLSEDSEFSEFSENSKIIRVLTKIDRHTQPVPSGIIPISAKENIGIDKLTEALIKAADIPEIRENDVIITNARHHAALAQALEAMHRVKEAMSLNLSGDLIAEDLRQVLHHLAEVTGTQITSDQVLQNIFRNFCVGK